MRLPGFAALISAFRAGLLPPLAMTYAQTNPSVAPGNFSTSGSVTFGTSLASGGFVIRALTAAEITTLSMSGDAYVLYEVGQNRGMLFQGNLIGGVQIAAGVVTGVSDFITGTLDTWSVTAAGLVDRVRAIPTTGWGHAAIYAGGTIQHQTNAAPTNVTFTSNIGAAAHYRLRATALVKTATAIALKLKVTYTGADGVAKSDIIWMQLQATGAFINGVATADRATGQVDILTDNSNGIITVADNAGTYTTCEYWLDVILEEVA